MQLETERAMPPTGATPGLGNQTATPHESTTGRPETTISAPKQPTRFHGTVVLDPARVGRDASRIADEVIAHLSSLLGAKVKVTLEIEAEIPTGAPDGVVRTVTENSQTLKFTSHGFEEE